MKMTGAQAGRVLLLAVAVGIAGVKAGGTRQTAPGTNSTAPQGGVRGGTIPSISGYRLGEIRLIGARVLPREIIQSSLGMVSGEVYDESKLRKGLEDLKKLYGEGGYVTFLPEPVLAFDEQRRVVNLTLNIDEGLQYILRSISFTGNTTVPDAVLRREIRLTEGFAFNSKLLEASLPRLNQLGLFEEVKIQDFMLTPHPDEGKLDVVLNVKENRR